MERAIRSLTLPPGLNHSSLAKIRAVPRAKRGSSTRGVAPIAEERSPAGCGAVSGGESLAAKFGTPLDDNKKSPGECRGSSIRGVRNGSVGLLGPASGVALAAVDRL